MTAHQRPSKRRASQSAAERAQTRSISERRRKVRADQREHMHGRVAVQAQFGNGSLHCVYTLDTSHTLLAHKACDITTISGRATWRQATSRCTAVKRTRMNLEHLL